MGLPAFSTVIRRTAAAALVLVCACSSTPKVLPSTDIDEALFRDAVRILASDDFEGRRPGTPGEDKTVSFLTERFRKLGLKPGNGQSFTQSVPLIETTPLSATVSISTAKGEAHRLEVGKEVVLWSARGGDVQELKGSEVVFVGYGVVAPEYRWNDYLGLDVHGKTVLVLSGDPGVAGRDPKLFKGNSLSAYGRWQYKIEEAARQGAAAILMVHDPALAGYGFGVVQTSWGGTQLKLAGDADGPRSQLEAWISGEAARKLFELAALNYDGMVAAAGQSGFKPSSFRLTLDASLRSSSRAVLSNNVMALLPGHGHKDEYVIFAAHWDSLGMKTQGDVRTVYTGAVDNASGVAGLIALAQSFVRTQPGLERTMVFLATTAGQPNLLGSTYYMQYPVLPLRQTAAFINVDTLLVGGHTRDVSILGFGSSELENSAKAEALLQGRESHPDPYPQLGLYYRSDAYVFAHFGVPALYAVSGIDNAARGPDYGRAQRQEYLARHFRQATDQYSPEWDVRGALDDLTLYYGVGGRVAHSRNFPRWYPNSEYRAHRDEGGAPPN
jgi:Zn-dependent M28 family amino/carboxypeptidase